MGRGKTPQEDPRFRCAIRRRLAPPIRHAWWCLERIGGGYSRGAHRCYVSSTAQWGRHPMNERVISRRLIEQRSRLLAIQEALSLGSADAAPAEAPGGEVSSGDQHIADIGSQTFEREKDISILSGVDAELADVEWALRRLADGTYGTCEACGRSIGTARLQARPATRFCIEDQLRKEREVRT